MQFTFKNQDVKIVVILPACCENEISKKNVCTLVKKLP